MAYLNVVTYVYGFLDSQGFKVFLRLMWEPFEEQFKLIETRFLNNADIVFRLAMIHSANVGHQNHSYNQDIQERQEGDYYSCKIVRR